MRKITTLLILIFIVNIHHSLLSQNDVIHTLYITGNLGAVSSNSTYVANKIKEEKGNSSLLILGISVAMPDSSNVARNNAELLFQKQLALLEGYNGEVYLVPNEANWANGKKNGARYMANLNAYIDSLTMTNISLVPKGACPGPTEIALNDQITLLVVDTEYILYPWDKPKDDCPSKSTIDLIEQIDLALTENKNKRVIMATHHPVISDGPFGKKKLAGIQYISHPKNKAMSKVVYDLCEPYSNVINVSSHDNSLQYINKNQGHFIISGAGTESSTLKPSKDSKYAKAATGYTKLIYYSNGDVKLEFWLTGAAQPDYSEIIMNKPFIAPPSIEQYVGSVNFDDSTHLRHISDQYSKGSKWLFGENYRTLWKMDVDFPVFDIGKEHGGLKIVQRGGGQQTKSLRLEAADGKQYVLRSIEKYATQAVPEALRSTFAADLIQDQISASNPFGAFVIPYLASVAGIYHTNPQAVFIPDDPRFGEYRGDFANTICLYEERPAGDQSDRPNFGNSPKLVNTPKVIEKRFKDNDNYVDEMWVLKSRLFDMFIADWDRHDDQWRWASFESGKGTMYRPVPRDRDQAFFVNNGLLMSLVARKWGMPKFQGFDHDFRYVPGFNFNARYFDRDFISEPSKADWLAVADTLQMKLTDEVIESAIKKWPKNVFDNKGEEVIAKLKSQRDNLKKYAEEQYLFLAKVVHVEGSNKKEYFHLERLDDEKTRVRMYKSTSKDKKDRKMFDRTFTRSETKEILLYGLGGKDKFKIDGAVNKGIKIRIIGGDGKDEIKDESSVKGASKKTWVYDTTNDNELEAGRETKDLRSDNEDVNEYNRNSFTYNKLIPLVTLGANPDDGFSAGGGFIFTKHGFRKDPFKSSHMFIGKLAFETGAFDAKYKGIFTEVIGSLDLEIGLQAIAPNNTHNFFGFGNETIFQEDINEDPLINVEDGIDYYRTRYNHYRADLFLNKRIGTTSVFSFGNRFESFQVEDDDYDGEARLILDPVFQGSTDGTSVFEWKSYDGLVMSYVYDGRDHKGMPKYGLHWKADMASYFAVAGPAENYSIVNSALSFYHTLRLPAKITFAARFGAGHNFGEFNYYQAQVISGLKEVRGYRKDRFFGESRLYNNLELRMKLFNFNNPVAPSGFGIIAFNDVGKVFSDIGQSEKWHHGYGGGVWLAPLDMAVLSLEVANSEEATVGLFRLGFMF